MRGIPGQLPDWETQPSLRQLADAATSTSRLSVVSDHVSVADVATAMSQQGHYTVDAATSAMRLFTDGSPSGKSTSRMSFSGDQVGTPLGTRFSPSPFMLHSRMSDRNGVGHAEGQTDVDDLHGTDAVTRAQARCDHLRQQLEDVEQAFAQYREQAQADQSLRDIVLSRQQNAVEILSRQNASLLLSGLIASHPPPLPQQPRPRPQPGRSASRSVPSLRAIMNGVSKISQLFPPPPSVSNPLGFNTAWQQGQPASDEADAHMASDLEPLPDNSAYDDPPPALEDTVAGLDFNLAHIPPSLLHFLRQAGHPFQFSADHGDAGASNAVDPLSVVQTLPSNVLARPTTYPAHLHLPTTADAIMGLKPMPLSPPHFGPHSTHGWGANAAPPYRRRPHLDTEAEVVGVKLRPQVAIPRVRRPSVALPDGPPPSRPASRDPAAGAGLSGTIAADDLQSNRPMSARPSSARTALTLRVGSGTPARTPSPRTGGTPDPSHYHSSSMLRFMPSPRQSAATIVPLDSTGVPPVTHQRPPLPPGPPPATHPSAPPQLPPGPPLPLPPPPPPIEPLLSARASVAAIWQANDASETAEDGSFVSARGVRHRSDIPYFPRIDSALLAPQQSTESISYGQGARPSTGHGAWTDRTGGARYGPGQLRVPINHLSAAPPPHRAPVRAFANATIGSGVLAPSLLLTGSPSIPAVRGSTAAVVSVDSMSLAIGPTPPSALTRPPNTARW